MVMQNNPLTSLPVKQLKEAIAIREKIERLERELNRLSVGQSFASAAVSAKQSRFNSARRAKISTTRRTGVKRFKAASGKSRRSAPRGHLKKRIIRALMAAGKPGVTIKELSHKLGTGYGNISVWFHTTAKGMKQVKKVAPGRFAWAS